MNHLLNLKQQALTRALNVVIDCVALSVTEHSSIQSRFGHLSCTQNLKSHATDGAIEKRQCCVGFSSL